MLAVGEGGVVTSRHAEIIAGIDRLKNFGFDGSRCSVGIGTNAKLSELSAAIGLRQLEALPARLRLRQAVLDAYAESLEPIGLTFQAGARDSALAFVPAVLPSHRLRDALMAALQEAGVECRCYYNPPVHRQPVFSDSSVHGSLTVTEDVAGRIISLPMADELEPSAIDRIAEVARGVVGG
jgi:dTDP-4-amino-4,6-dideoxygalactose transaminase